MKLWLMHSLIRLRAILGKEFLQLLRDPRMRFFIIMPPIAQLFLFGYAATFDVKNAQVAIVDDSRSAYSRDLLSAITATGEFNLHFYDNMVQADNAITRSDVRAIVHFSHDFEINKAIQVIADGSDSNSALLVTGQISEALRHHVLSGQAKGPPITIDQRAWFNPNMEDRQFFVPGIIANVVMLATIVLTAMTVVREREIGTLERLMVTPLARLEFVIGKVVPVACVGLFEVMLISLVAVFWFHVPFRGNALTLLFGSMLYLMSTLGLGLMLSSFSSTQQQAMLLAVFIIMPLIMLSGFAFPISNMPYGVQLLTWLDPLRFYLVVIRDIFLKGGSFSGHLLEFGMMALLGTVSMGLSMLRVR